MKNIWVLIASFLLIAGPLKGQQKYWLMFSDKGPEATFYAAHPEKVISSKALLRHKRHHHTLETADLPVSATYLQQLRTAGVKIVGTSRWFNAASVSTTLDFLSLQKICPAITDMRPVGRYVSVHALDGKHQASLLQGKEGTDSTATSTLNYGATQTQQALLNLPCLHDKGFTGSGVLMAVFDAGFYKVDTLAAFDSIWAENRVLTYYDFVNQDSSIFDENTHGLSVISTIVGNLPGQYVGTAPHATVAMARTEDVFSETHQEEDNWMMAMEWADSLGADIIQSSLGYNEFDFGEGDYVYQDMNGDSAIITIAADMAAARGILVVNSAGNEGNGAWRYITAPCDADSILCVGSVNPTGLRSGFSSWGPTADGRIKPDVMAMGGSASVIGSSGNPGNGNGTSFAAPQMAGFVACLIQAHPDRTNMEVIEAVRQSADRYTMPDSGYGYGVPDACRADSILSVLDSLALQAEVYAELASHLDFFPNPVQNQLTIEVRNPAIQVVQFSVISQEGKEMLLETPENGTQSSYQLDLKNLPAGMYILKLNLESGRTFSHKFIRQ